MESGSDAGRRGVPSEPGGGDELPGQGCSTGRRELMRPLQWQRAQGTEPPRRGPGGGP